MRHREERSDVAISTLGPKTVNCSLQYSSWALGWLYNIVADPALVNANTPYNYALCTFCLPLSKVKGVESDITNVSK